VPTNFKKSIEMMVHSGIRFVIIGGVAMRMQGTAHVTDDIDFSYSRDAEGLPGLIEMLNKHNVRLRNVSADLPFFFDLRTLKNTQNFTLVTDVGDIDLLAEPAGIDSFEGLWNRATAMEIFGLTVRVASIEDLIAMKRAAGRPKDKQHLLELLDLQQFLRDEAQHKEKESE
jgi:predicted nucleotidyltransferase